MDLVSLIVVITLIGLLTWAITTYVPMPEPIKRILIIVVLLVLILWLLRLFVGHVPLVVR
jgi:hypothetical protein